MNKKAQRHEGTRARRESLSPHAPVLIPRPSLPAFHCVPLL